MVDVLKARNTITQPNQVPQPHVRTIHVPQTLPSAPPALQPPSLKQIKKKSLFIQAEEGSLEADVIKVT